MATIYYDGDRVIALTGGPTNLVGTVKMYFETRDKKSAVILVEWDDGITQWHLPEHLELIPMENNNG